MSRSLDDLVPMFRAKLERALKAAVDPGFRLVPYSTLRTPQSQAKLWRQSRSEAEAKTAIAMLREASAPYLAAVMEEVGPQPAGPWRTGALPGLSWHQWGEAADCYVELPNGHPDWNGAHRGYAKLHAAALAEGLETGLHWTTPDPGHVQLRPNVSPRHFFSLAQIDAVMRERFEGSVAPAVPALPMETLPVSGGTPTRLELPPFEIELAARTVFGEARGEQEPGRVAVAWVIRNRLEIARRKGGYWWGNTVAEICLRHDGQGRYQFSPWNPADPNYRPMTTARMEQEPLSGCAAIVRGVFDGSRADPTGGAAHFHAAYLSPPPAWTHGFSGKAIGRHLFYVGVP